MPSSVYRIHAKVLAGRQGLRHGDTESESSMVPGKRECCGHEALEDRRCEGRTEGSSVYSSGRRKDDKHFDQRMAPIGFEPIWGYTARKSKNHLGHISSAERIRTSLDIELICITPQAQKEEERGKGMPSRGQSVGR